MTAQLAAAAGTTAAPRSSAAAAASAAMPAAPTAAGINAAVTADAPAAATASTMPGMPTAAEMSAPAATSAPNAAASDMTGVLNVSDIKHSAEPPAAAQCAHGANALRAAVPQPRPQAISLTKAVAADAVALAQLSRPAFNLAGIVGDKHACAGMPPNTATGTGSPSLLQSQACDLVGREAIKQASADQRHVRASFASPSPLWQPQACDLVGLVAIRRASAEQAPVGECEAPSPETVMQPAAGTPAAAPGAAERSMQQRPCDGAASGTHGTVDDSMEQQRSVQRTMRALQPLHANALEQALKSRPHQPGEACKDQAPLPSTDKCAAALPDSHPAKADSAKSGTHAELVQLPSAEAAAVGLGSGQHGAEGSHLAVASPVVQGDGAGQLQECQMCKCVLQ